MDRLELALLWHMHQPPYRDPASGTYVLPWVRLHATRGYLDMARIHERFPGVRATVNFSPILLEQLEDYAAGRARDRFQELSARAPGDLTEEERVLLLRTFFMVSWEQGVRPLLRYRELLHKRGLDLSEVDLHQMAKLFTPADLRDLQVLFNLAWMGFAARERDPAVQGLLQKGRDFDEGDKAALFEAQTRLVAEVIPAWQAVARRGAVEISATPYYHPILPLLCDTDSARVAMPQVELPPRLRARDDAEEQVRRAQRKMEAIFGAPPAGMWPAEGSVSPEALAVFARAGVRWLGSDEEVLFRSLPPETERVAALYRSWMVDAGDGSIAMVFRDRGISDAIGFTYARSPARDAVSDLLGNLQKIAQSAPRQGGEPPLASVILDGENPWEHYPDSGHDFLHELYSRLERKEGGISTTSVGARIGRGVPAGEVEKIHAGSWVEANFRIWIGHPEDVAAWTLVGEARRAWEEATKEGASPDRLEAARDLLLEAEASDWFWWYGEDFITETRSEFDRLFRDRIQLVFRTLGREPPALAMDPIAGSGIRGEVVPSRAPVGFLHPQIDGEVTSWQEWLGAGVFLADQVRSGSMHQASGTFACLHYGFDLDTFYLRLDPVWDVVAQILTRFDSLRIEMRVNGREIEVSSKLSSGKLLPYDEEQGKVMGEGCFGSVVEIALPFAELGLFAGQRIRFLVRGMRGPVEAERIPAQGWLAFDVPDESFEQRVWKV